MTSHRSNAKTPALATDLATGKTFGDTLHGNGFGAFCKLVDRCAAALFGAPAGATRSAGDDTFAWNGHTFTLEFFSGRN